MSTQSLNKLEFGEIYTDYNWYKKSFLPLMQQCFSEFFVSEFEIGLLGICKNINPLMEKDSYFVTKIKINKQYDIFFRANEQTISVILEKVLGKSTGRFDLNKITDLEAKIITSFNDSLYSIIEPLINKSVNNKTVNFDLVHLNFTIKNEFGLGKFIISIPTDIVTPETITSSGEKFDNGMFKTSTIDVKLEIGKTKFTMFEVKNLDIDDIVVFEDSNSRNLTLIVGDYTKDVKLNPNLGLVTNEEINTGDNTMKSSNLWDSIEVEMVAELDPVKITLGELKNIEDGMVVDLTSIYDNKVTLKVENNEIAHGELVIINDRYGVKITDIVVQKPETVAPVNETPPENPGVPTDEKSNNDEFDEEFDETNNNDDNFENNTDNQNQNEDDEFDYSDFEIEDEDI